MLRFLFAVAFGIFLLFNCSKGFSKDPSPYFFVENKGQWPKEVAFKADIPSGKLFLHKNSLTYLFYDLSKVHSSHTHHTQSSQARSSIAYPTDEIKMHAFKIEYEGSNLVPEFEQTNQRSEIYHYHKNSSVSSTAFETILNKNLYKEIDLKFYNEKTQLKYDFIVKPGGNAKVILMNYTGINSIKSENGNLYIETSVSQIIEQKPYAYQIKGKDTVQVECRYKLSGTKVSFDFPSGYNKKLDLIIDPILIFSTYSGSVSDNWGNTATPGENGTLYSGGIVFGPNYPTTLGAFSTTYSQNVDVAIMKFDSTGAQLIYSAFLGGSSAEIPHSLIVNSNHELVILGTTSSLNFPVSENAFQKSHNSGPSILPYGHNIVNYVNGSDLFITKINAAGNAIIASTFLGGSGTDGIFDIFSPLVKNYGDQFRGDINIDKENNILITSATSSLNYPVLNGFQLSHAGGEYDGVVTKLNQDLSEIIWSSYLGGSNLDGAFTIKINSNSEVYIGGATMSSDLQKTAGAINPSYLGNNDGYVSRISADGKELIRTTYLGTSHYDHAFLIDLDLDENVYVLGQTQGLYPVSNGVYKVDRGGQFIHKLNKELNTSIFSTVFGTTSNQINPNISPTAFLVSECGNLYVTGWGGETNEYTNQLVGGNTFNLPITSDAFKKTTDGSDFYLMVLSPNAQKILYATYFGGNSPRGHEHVDGGTSRFDKKGIVYHTVCSGCLEAENQQNFKPSYPTTTGAWSQTMNSDNCNMAAFKFDLATLESHFEIDNANICKKPYIVNINNTSSGAVNYIWNFGDGTTSTNPNIGSHVYQNPGEYTITLEASNTESCGSKQAIFSQTIKISSPNFFVGEGKVVCQGESYQLTSSGGVSYHWTPSKSINNATIASPTVTPDTSTYYKVVITDANGCIHSDSVLVEVIKEVRPEFETSFSFSCNEKPVFQFTNLSINAENYFWDFGDGTTSTEENPVHVFPKDSVYTVKLSAGNKQCGNTKVVSIPVKETFIPNVFTPNGDSKNDFFEIKSQGPFKIVIVNRWGKEIYSNDEYQNDWNAKDLSSGTYFYSLTNKDGKECKGWVQVLK